MVRGLDLFRSHFPGFEDQYVLIGGTACYLAMEDARLADTMALLARFLPM